MRPLCINAMSDILRCRRAPDVNVKLRFPFIIYCITILFQALIVGVLANMPISANTVDPAYGYIPNKTVEAQIARGTNVKEGEFPYVAGIYLGEYLICNGVILSSLWMLTRAICIVKGDGTHTSTTFELAAPKSEYYIGYGSTNYTKFDYASIGDVWVHPQYNFGYYYDLIKFATPLPSNGKWSPARITPEIVSSGEELILLSWGGSKYGGMSSILQKTRLILKSFFFSFCIHTRRTHATKDTPDGRLVL
jgi:hypothetical protein